GPGGVPRPWRAPRVTWSYLQPRLLRYNRVEGLALGARVDADFGPLAADGTLWLPTARRDVAAELGLVRRGFAARQRLALYHRVAPVDPAARALGIGNSLSAALLGRDDGDYFVA